MSCFHRYLANPIMRHVAGHVPGLAVIETVGRHSCLPRYTPIGGRLEEGSFCTSACAGCLDSTACSSAPSAPTC